MPRRTESLDRYRTSLRDAAALDADTERTLAERFRAGDKAAGEALIRGSLPFVISIALEYRRWEAPLEDLVQQGNLGLLKAAAKFDPSRECRLVTYAVYWIRAEIRDYVIRNYRLVRIGTTKAERRAVRAYRRQRIEDPAELAAASGLSVEQVERLLPLLRARDVSLDVVHGDEGPGIDRVADATPGVDEIYDAARRRALARKRVREALDRLPEREALIIRERMLSDDPVTLEALGQRLGISKERVRQLEERARKKLRADLGEVAA